MTEFSKKTGDYPVLSATDLRVLALAHTLHRDYVGTDSLRTEPVKSVKVTRKPGGVADDALPGFYRPGPKGKNGPGVVKSEGDESNEIETEGEAKLDEQPEKKKGTDAGGKESSACDEDGSEDKLMGKVVADANLADKPEISKDQEAEKNGEPESDGESSEEVAVEILSDDEIIEEGVFHNG